MTDQQQPNQPQLPVIPSTTPGQASNQGFSLGLATSTQPKKGAPQTAAEMADKRNKELHGDQNFVESSKRGRVEYAETLRKKRRDDHQRAKRQNLNTATNIGDAAKAFPAAAAGGAALNAANASQQLISFGHQTLNSGRKIDQILAQAQSMSLEQVIQEGNNMTCEQSDFDQIVNLLTSDIQVVQILAVTGLRKLLSFETDPPIQKTVDRNLIPRLFQLGQCVESPKLQFEAIWCLTNIASSDSHFVLKLIENQAMPILISIMDSPTHIEVKEQTIWCLGNISGDNSRFRDALLDQGVLPKICELIDSAAANTSFVRNAIWTLSNLCKGKPPADFEKVQRAIQTFAKVLAESDTPEILNDICWTLSYITDEGGDERIVVFLQCNMVPRLCTLLRHEQMIIAVPALRTLGNILTARDEYAQAAIDCGVLEAFTQLLDHPKKAIRKEICWSISNVTAGNASQIQRCLDIGLIDKIISIMSSSALDLKVEAVWCLSNSTAQATPEQIKTLVEKGIFQAIGSVLESRDPRTLVVALEGINFILKCGREHLLDANGNNPMVVVAEQCGLVDKIEQLQLVKNQKVYEKAIDILETYFILEEQEDIMEMLNSQQTTQTAPSVGQEAGSLWGQSSESGPQNNKFQF